jgi:hypothetical protein
VLTTNRFESHGIFEPYRTLSLAGLRTIRPIEGFMMLQGSVQNETRGSRHLQRRC